MKATRAHRHAFAAFALMVSMSATAAKDTGHPMNELTSGNIPVTELKYFATGVGPLQAAPAFGDLAHSAHGTFIKMPAGFVSPTHIHSEDYYAVVVSGVGANALPGGKEVPLPVGSYWFQKGKEPHVTRCISSNECIFFIVQSGKFDYVAEGN